MEKSSLTVPILDALSNLNLNPELMTEVKILSIRNMTEVKVAL